MRMGKVFLLSAWCLAFVLPLLGGCSEATPQQAGSIMKNAAVEEWQRDHPALKMVKAACGDLNDDGAADTVIIYRENTKKCWMQVIFDLSGQYLVTDPTPAPVENQAIEFRDIDGKAPTELIVSGMKGTNVGYAIYRWQGGRLVNLFAENMHGCC